MTVKLSDAVARLGRRLAPAVPDADAELLGRFLADHDEAAFAELVRRHGPLVFGVCKRVTGDHHLAEDAFQAVFVVLARKAGAVRPRASLPGWLYAVAHRTALRARTMSDRRRRHELLSGGRQPPEPGIEHDLVALLDEEVSRLPDGLRLAVVRCELQGVSRKEAAKEFGVPEGTVSSRLAAARKALAARLRARGVALSAAGLTAGLGQVAAAGVPGELVARAVAASLGPVPAAVAALSNGVTLTMFLHNLAPAVGGLLLVAAAGGLVLAADPPAAPAAKVGPPAAAGPAARKPAAAEPAGPNRLVFCRNNRLVRIDPAGQDETTFLADGVNTRTSLDGLRSSPDGKRVAYLANAPDATDPPPATGVPFHLYVVGADAREAESLEVSPRSFAWSRDGTTVAVSEFPVSDKKLAAVHTLVNVTTKEKTPLKLPADHYVTDWSRDGKHLMTTRIWPEAGVFLMNLDGTGQRHLTEKRLPAGRRAVGGRLSPDGTRVLLTVVTPGANGAETKSELAVLSTATGAVTPVADTPLNGDISSYCWSPDGKRIAYEWSESPAGQQKIESAVVVCDPDGRNATTVASGIGPVGTIVGLDWR